MKQILIIIFLVVASWFSGFAQRDGRKVEAYGYYKASADYVVDSVQVIVQYRRTQVVINNATKQHETLNDTLTLAIGQRWSVFCNTRYDNRRAAWFANNRKRSRLATKPFSVKPVPLSSVLEKKDAGEDYMENYGGEPVVLYTDRKTGVAISCLYDIINKECVQKGIGFENAWTFQEGQDTVLNYVCSKAVAHYSGRDYTAWFSMEIPIPCGPWKLGSLPGLILKAEDAESLVQFEAIGVEMPENAVITMNDDLELVEFDYFCKLADKARSVRIGSFFYQGEVIFVESNPYTFIEMEKEGR